MRIELVSRYVCKMMASLSIYKFRNIERAREIYLLLLPLYPLNRWALLLLYLRAVCFGYSLHIRCRKQARDYRGVFFILKIVSLPIFIDLLGACVYVYGCVFVCGGALISTTTCKKKKHNKLNYFDLNSVELLANYFVFLYFSDSVECCVCVCTGCN